MKTEEEIRTHRREIYNELIRVKRMLVEMEIDYDVDRYISKIAVLTWVLEDSDK